MFGVRTVRDAEVQHRQEPVSDAPFRMEFAPGVVILDAEIRDRASLATFVKALQAMAELLPETLAEQEPMRDVTPPTQLPAAASGQESAVREIDLTPPATA